MLPRKACDGLMPEPLRLIPLRTGSGRDYGIRAWVESIRPDRGMFRSVSYGQKQWTS